MIGVGIWRKSLKTCGERAHRDTKGDPNIGAASDAVGPDARPDDSDGDYRALADAIHEFAANAGRGVADQPVASALFALIAGILIGASSLDEKERSPHVRCHSARSQVALEIGSFDRRCLGQFGAAPWDAAVACEPDWRVRLGDAQLGWVLCVTAELGSGRRGGYRRRCRHHSRRGFGGRCEPINSRLRTGFRARSSAGGYGGDHERRRGVASSFRGAAADIRGVGNSVRGFLHNPLGAAGGKLLIPAVGALIRALRSHKTTPDRSAQ